MFTEIGYRHIYIPGQIPGSAPCFLFSFDMFYSKVVATVEDKLIHYIITNDLVVVQLYIVEATTIVLSIQ